MKSVQLRFFRIREAIFFQLSLIKRNFDGGDFRQKLEKTEFLSFTGCK